MTRDDPQPAIGMDDARIPASDAQRKATSSKVAAPAPAAKHPENVNYAEPQFAAPRQLMTWRWFPPKLPQRMLRCPSMLQFRSCRKKSSLRPSQRGQTPRRQFPKSQRRRRSITFLREKFNPVSPARDPIHPALQTQVARNFAGPQHAAPSIVIDATSEALAASETYDSGSSDVAASTAAAVVQASLVTSSAAPQVPKAAIAKVVDASAGKSSRSSVSAPQTGSLPQTPDKSVSAVKGGSSKENTQRDDNNAQGRQTTLADSATPAPSHGVAAAHGHEQPVAPAAAPPAAVSAEVKTAVNPAPASTLVAKNDAALPASATHTPMPDGTILQSSQPAAPGGPERDAGWHAHGRSRQC